MRDYFLFLITCNFSNLAGLKIEITKLIRKILMYSNNRICCHITYNDYKRKNSQLHGSPDKKKETFPKCNVNLVPEV